MLRYRYIIVQLGLVGPLMTISTTVMREVTRLSFLVFVLNINLSVSQVQRQAGSKLREHFSSEQVAMLNQPMKAQPVNGTESRRVEREKEDMIH